MDTKYKLINSAQKRSDELQRIAENYKWLANTIKEDPKKLMEGATQVLAGLKAMMAAGQPLTKAGLSPASLAGVVAGLRVLSRALPKMADPDKKLKALKVLTDLKIGGNMSTGAATSIAGLADRDPQLEELRAAFNQYAETGQPNPAVLKLLGQLQMEIDQAMRASAGGGQQVPAGPGVAPAVAAAGAASPMGQAR
jgi:hypothetical protein